MGFLRVFIHYCTKSLRNFTVLLWWWSNFKDSRLFDRARCASNKMDNFIRRNKKFWAKELKKNGFFGVFTHYCTKSIRNFSVLLWWCSNLKDSRLLDRARCASNEMNNFIRMKKVLGQKTSKKLVFWGFHTLLHWIASQFYCSAPMMLKLTGCSPIWLGKVRQ